jgi:hypothetical protein
VWTRWTRGLQPSSGSPWSLHSLCASLPHHRCRDQTLQSRAWSSLGLKNVTDNSHCGSHDNCQAAGNNAEGADQRNYFEIFHFFVYNFFMRGRVLSW